MNQKTLIALGAMVTIAILAFVTLKTPEKGERNGPKVRPIAAFKADQVKELELTSNNGKDKATLKLDGGKWAVASPSPFPADQQLVKTALEQLEKIQFGDMVTDKKEKFVDLELSDDKGAHVIAKDGGGKALFDAWIGKSVSGFTMIRPADGPNKDQAWQSTGLFKYTYAKDAKAWRDHSMLSFSHDDTTRLSVESNGQKLVLEKLAPPAPAGDDKDKKPPAESHWKVVESTVKVDPLDEQVANSMVTALSSLAAADFDDGNDYAAAGLTQPRFKITVTNKGAPVTLLIGKLKGDDEWAQLEGKPQMYLLHKYSLERVAVKPADFRDKTIVKVKPEELAQIDIQTGGQTTTLVKSGNTWAFPKVKGENKGELDMGKVTPITTGFEALKGSSFADTTDAAITGLGKSQNGITLTLQDKSKVVLKIGSLNKENTDYFVQKVGSPDVVMIKKFQIDRFLKKPIELVKTGGPGR